MTKRHCVPRNIDELSMSSAPIKPVDVPPYQVQSLISSIAESEGFDPAKVQVRCAQASGSEIYIGCSNGQLFRFALQADEPDKPEAYAVLSRETTPNEKPIDEIVLVPCLSRAFVLSDRTLHFYALPSLNMVPPSTVKPIRHVVAFTIDHYDLQRPALALNGPGSTLSSADPVNFCVIKRTSIALYVMRERLNYLKEIPLPDAATCAKRIGHSLCIADRENYNLIDLEDTQFLPIIPLNQAPSFDESSTVPHVKPSITVIGMNEFLILSSTGAAGTMGLFITTAGDPVRGTLQWPDHPESVSLDYPYITALLPNETIEVHNIETQEIVQVIGAPTNRTLQEPNQSLRLRHGLISSLNGYLVPSTQQSEKMRLVEVKLLRGGLKEATLSTSP